MFDILQSLLGVDLSLYYVPDQILYVCCFILVLFCVGEFFNIIRVIINFAFGKR